MPVSTVLSPAGKSCGAALAEKVCRSITKSSDGFLMVENCPKDAAKVEMPSESSSYIYCQQVAAKIASNDNLF